MARVKKTEQKQEWLLHPEKKGTMQLPVAIDEGLIAKLDARLRAITTELLDQEAKKKEQVAPINKRMAELREEQKHLVARVKSGQTLVEVDVEERANFESGEAWMIRLDTGDEVPNTRRALTHAERQTFTKRGADGELERVPPRRVESAPAEDDESAEDPDGGEDEEDESSDDGDSDSLIAGTSESTAGSERVAHSPFRHPVVGAVGESVLHLPEPHRDWCAVWPAVGLDVRFYDRGAVMGSARWNDFGGEEQKGGWDRSGDSARVPAAVLESVAGAIIVGNFKRGSREALADQRRGELEASPVSCTGKPECTNLVPVGKKPAVCDACSGRETNPPLWLGLDGVRPGWGCLVEDGQLYFSQGGEADRIGGFLWSEEALGLVRAPQGRVPELWPDEHQDLLDVVTALVARGELHLASLEAPPDAKAEQKEHTLFYPLPQPEDVKRSLDGWKLAVGQGRAMVCQPDGKLVGPFLWRERKGISDRVDFSVTNEWMATYGEDVLPAVDVLVLSGQVREPFEGYTPRRTRPSHGGLEVDTKPGAGENPSQAAGESVPEDAELRPGHAKSVAEGLSGYAPKVLMALRSKGSMGVVALGLEVQTAKPGAVINRLVKDGLVQVDGDAVALTKRGASVAAALEEIDTRKRKKK